MDWYQITAKANRSAVIQIYGFIGDSWDEDGVTASRFFKEVKGLDVDEIELHINSPGGSVFDGFAIYNLLKAHKATVNAVIDAMAASIASVIAMAGDTVEMPESAMMMIHDPSGLVIGTAVDMKKMAEALDKIKKGIISAYHDKTEMDTEKLGRLMTDETWMTAKEAVLLGFADTMTAKMEIEACADAKSLKMFKNVPAHVVNAVSASSHKIKPKEKDDMEITAEILKKNHPEIVAALITEAITAACLKENHADVVAELIAGAKAEAGEAGAVSERERIQAVLGQSMPGHEDLVNTLAFDGKTTAEQAAVQILAAEKKIRANANGNIASDAIDPLKHVEPPLVDKKKAGDDDDNDLPVEDRAKAEWDKDGKLRKEFDNDYDSYLAYFKAVDGGKVRVLKSK